MRCSWTGTAAGSYGGTISFDSNDANEDPFDFNVSGTVSVWVPPAPEPSITIVDDGDAGYSAVGGWSTYNGVGTQGDFDYKGVGSGAGIASWTLAGLAPGNYRVSVTWEPFNNRSEAVPYTVLDGATALGTILFDQRNAPADFAEDGVLWQDVGTYQVTGNDLTVELSDDAGRAGSYVDR